MTAADFRRIALSLEGVEEYSHVGLPAFRVGGRKFASLASQAQGYGNLMLTLKQHRRLWRRRPRYSCRFRAAGERWDTRIFAWPPRAKTHWRVRCERPGNCELIRTQRRADRIPMRRRAAEQQIGNTGGATMRTPTAQNRNSSKKDLSPQQREELLGALEARFERNMTAIKVLNGLKYKRSWKLTPKDCGHSMKWKEPAPNRT